MSGTGRAMLVLVGVVVGILLNLYQSQDRRRQDQVTVPIIVFLIALESSPGAHCN